MDAAFEQRAAAGQRRIVPPVGRHLGLQRVQVNESNVPDVPVLDDLAEPPRQRLVEIVLGDQHLPSGRRRGHRHLVEIRRSQERRLLDDHVLARRKCAERPFEVSRGRQRDEHHGDLGAFDRRRIVGEVARPPVPSGSGGGSAGVAAGVKPPHLWRNRAQRLAVDPGREARSEKRDPKGPAPFRSRHSNSAMCVPVRSALAAIVNEGFTPPERGRALPSVTNRLSRPR